jgi:hypothetical protein
MTASAPQGIPPEYAGNLPPRPAAAATAHARVRVKETDEHLYARQTRNATVFMAWIVGIFTVFSVVVGIVAAIALTHLAASVSSTSGGNGSNFACIYNGTC